MDLEARFQDLANSALVSIVLGGRFRLLRPFGQLALCIGQGRCILDTDLRSRIMVVRVRRARLLAPVDTLPEPEASDWALLAALNDLIQTTNHELSGGLSRSRHYRLLSCTEDVCQAIALPKTVGEALARHSIFARALDIVRKDSTVSWWTGSANFRGQRPPGRLLTWPELRRVHVDHRMVPIHAMTVGVSALPHDGFLEALSLWLTRSPLTDLANAARTEPIFQWSESTLRLIAAPPGRVLAYRALCRTSREAAVMSLRRATERLAPGQAKDLAQGFLKELEEQKVA